MTYPAHVLIGYGLELFGVDKAEVSGARLGPCMEKASSKFNERGTVGWDIYPGQGRSSEAPKSLVWLSVFVIL